MSATSPAKPFKVIVGTPPPGADGPQGAGGRRSPRRVYRRPVGILVRGKYQVLEGRNLSEGGILIAHSSAATQEGSLSLSDLAIGSRVAISLILPAGSSVVLRGEIIYSKAEEAGKAGSPNTHAFGIKFDLVPLHQRREIRNYVSAKQAGEADV